MIVNKQITKTSVYDVSFFVGSYDMLYGEFIEMRNRVGLNSDLFDTCFCCGYKYEDDDTPSVVIVSGLGNRTVCQKCLKQHTENTMQQGGREL